MDRNKKEGEEMLNERTPMSVLMTCLNNEGFTDEFMMVEKGLMSLDTKQILQPGDIEALEYYRFEGFSDPDDTAILFAVRTKSGLKGTVVDAFGVYGNQELMEFMNQIEESKVLREPVDAIGRCVECL